jgi:hypothetical protein
MKLKPGDRVSCKVKSCQVINAYADDWDDKFTFEVVSIDNRGYYIYIPHYIYIKGCLKVNEYNLKTYEINKRFIGENILYILENSIIQIEIKSDGLVCTRCKEFSALAECKDSAFICWACRTYPYR